MQRIIFGILAAVLSIGLIASSIAWTGIGTGTPKEAKVPGTVEERIKMLEEQSKEKPNDTDILLSLAALYTQAGKIGQASDTYERIIKLDPKNIQALQNLSLLHYTQGKTDAAEQQLKKALAVEPDNADVNYQYAKLLAERKDYRGAIAAMEKVLAAQKEGPRAEEARKAIESWKTSAGQP